MTHGLAQLAASVAVVAVGLVLSVGPFPAASAQAPAAGIDPLIPDDITKAKTAFTACKKCHNYKSRKDAEGDDFATDFQSNEFVLLSEGTTWKQQDPHSRAYAVLLADPTGKPALGPQMSKLLGYKVHESAKCLACHAIDKAPHLPLAAKIHDTHFDTDDGITCNACHGLKQPWQIEHYEGGPGKVVPWRLLDPAKKYASGLRSLRDPKVRAEFCATCHVGSAAEGKVVTHEMYAAGHPPLPPFELGTFMDCQPKHWGDPTGVHSSLKFFTPDAVAKYAEKSKKTLPENWQWALYRFHADEVLAARSVTAGAVAALAAEMRMLAADAAGAGGKDWDGIDYARFDCYACHHDLKVPSPRQERGYAGKPGRPPMKAWLGALPGVVAEHAATLSPLAGAAKDFPAKWEAVRTAALARPFGDPAAVQKAAGEMAAWCDTFLKTAEADGRPLYTKAESEKLLAAIAAAATSKTWTADPEAAMHLTWAYLSLRDGMGLAPQAGAVDALGKTVPVRVRDRRKKADGTETYSDDDGLPLPAGKAIAPRLKLFAGFRADDFTARFADLLKK